MKLQYRIGKLELDNMELEQSRIVHESAMRGKDLTIQKLQLQVLESLNLVASSRVGINGSMSPDSRSSPG